MYCSNLSNSKEVVDLDWEKLATTAVESSISKTERLSSFINSGDKEPAWDGNIYIHSDSKHSKKDIKKIATQVKGKGVSAKVKSTIKYLISTTDLKAYMNNGGTMFFVVYIDKDTGETKQIYYSALTPFKIMEIMKGKSSEKKSYSVLFKSFPEDACEKTEIFLNFYSEAKRQASFAGRDIPTIEQLQEQGVLESLSLHYTGFRKYDPRALLPKLIDGKEMTLYANIKGGTAPIPVQYYDNIRQFTMSREDDLPIIVNGTTYYDKYSIITTSKKVVLKIGNSVKFNFKDLDSPNDIGTVKLNVKICGTLTQRIKALEFLIAMLGNKKFSIGEHEFPVDFDESELKKLNPSEYPKMLSGYKRAQAVLDTLHVRKDLDLDKFTSEDFWKLNSLIEAIECGKPVYKVKGDLPIIVNMNIPDIHLALICKKNEDGSYNIWDYFNKQLTVKVVNDEGESYPTSQYSIMTESDFLTVDNLNLQAIIDDYKQIEPQETIVDSANMLVLEMLKAYDKNSSQDLLSAAYELTIWIESQPDYITKEVVTINKLQIILRQRPLSYKEKQQLHDIISTGDELLKIGAFLLLDEQEEAKNIFDGLSQENKESFKNFPIYYFWKKG